MTLTSRLAAHRFSPWSLLWLSLSTSLVLVESFTTLRTNQQQTSLRFGGLTRQFASVADSSSSTADATLPTDNNMIAFAKYHGLGNDFLLIDNRDQLEPSLSPQESQALCHRNFGIGGDGVIFALQSPNDAFDCAMRIYNSDGSEPEMCGNGIRCLAKFLQALDAKTTTTTKDSYTIHTLAGPIVPVLNLDGTVTVDMGEPILQASQVPTTLKPNFDNESVVELPVVAPNNPDKTWKISAVSMGNPHAIIFVDDLETDVDLATDGPALESATNLFPAKTNVEFVQVLGPQHLRMKVWERGAGPTLACGTGTCALVVAACRAGKIPTTLPNQPCRVTLPGGDLWIEWNQDNNKVYMSGPAEFVFEGQAPRPALE